MSRLNKSIRIIYMVTSYQSIKVCIFLFNLDAKSKWYQASRLNKDTHFFNILINSVIFATKITEVMRI